MGRVNVDLKRMVELLLLVGGVVAANAPLVHAADAPAASAIQDNMDVGLEYTLTVDGAVVDSTEGKEAFHYIQGQKQVIPGLERQLAGLHVGDTKDVTVNPEEGYGQVDPSAIVEVPKTQLPNGVTPEVGMMLRGVNPNGQTFRARIKEMKADTVVLDLNHPLAGKTLNFKVKVVSVSLAPAPQAASAPASTSAPAAAPEAPPASTSAPAPSPQQATGS